MDEQKEKRDVLYVRAFPPELKEQLQQEALRQKIPVNQLVIHCIEKYLVGSDRD